jgi:hypothetical protein
MRKRRLIDTTLTKENVFVLEIMLSVLGRLTWTILDDIDRSLSPRYTLGRIQSLNECFAAELELAPLVPGRKMISRITSLSATS